MENQPLPPNIHPSWHEHLQPLFNDPKMNMIKNQLLPNCKFYPERSQIFRVFEMPITAIRVIVLGADPYPNGQATGLSFGVRLYDYGKLPPSLKVIQNEVYNSSTLQAFKKHEGITWQTLEHWWKQGVFLLNTALTVEQKNAGSHLGQWQWFTREVIKIIVNHKKAVWLLWGAKAKVYADYIPDSIVLPSYINKNMGISIDSSIDAPNTNFVLFADHPAAEAYPNSEYKFTGCNHFNICNEILKAKNQSPIKW